MTARQLDILFRQFRRAQRIHDRLAVTLLSRRIEAALR